VQYEFNRRDAFDFASRQGSKTKVRGNELQFTYCPYCHGGKSRDKNTFAINLDTGQYKCLRSSCDVSGNFITLARDFDFSLGADYDSFYTNRKQYRKLPTKAIKSKDKAIEYMKSRGISEAITRKYEITVQKDDENILVFPFKDENSNLQFIKYRNINPDRKGSKEWCEANCKPILFGMNHCNLDNKTLVITEGQIDSLSLSECGIENAVSVPNGALGFTWVPYCWEWMNKFETLIVFGDFENGSMTLLEDLKKRFKGSIKAVCEKDYLGCKDANQLLKKHGKRAVINAVHKAELIPIARVKQLADVKAVDIYSLPKITSGIKEIDKLLGGFYYGQLILLSGRRGEGKSTFMSQLIAESIEQDNPVFIYSGELNDFYFKRWLDLQLAGPKKLIMTRDSKGFEYPTITKSTVDKISEWYRNKAFIYDNNVIEDNEMDDLLQIIEKSIMQYGIKLVCIDNLMTALDVAMSDDLYRAQSKFVGKLAKMAKQYEVVIILVAHPRKQSLELTNDDVSGSSDITNRVDIVMNYTTKKDMPPDERILTITKNRLTGKITKAGEGIKLYFHEGSKRIYGEKDNLYKVYGWEDDKDDTGFMPVQEDAELPFM
jgi:hypothetical protein